jgi:hypothetical protein
MPHPLNAINFIYAMCCFSGSDPSSQTVQKTNLESCTPSDAHSQPEIRTRQRDK